MQHLLVQSGAQPEHPLHLTRLGHNRRLKQGQGQQNVKLCGMERFAASG